MSLPLAGRRVLVTRATHQAGKLSNALRDLGLEPVEVPVLEIREPENSEALDRALRQLNTYDWLILTSANTVAALKKRARILGISLGGSAEPVVPQVAAIGEATAIAAREAGLTVALVPKTYVAESLLDGLAGQTEGKRILLARSAIARNVIPDTLRAAGAEVDLWEAYRNFIPDSAPAELRQALTEGIDAATFTSSSSVTHLAEVAKRAGIPFPLANVPAVSVGPVTSGTLRELDWEPAAEASPSDIPGLASAVAKLLR